jgi:hypothetical protein
MYNEPATACIVGNFCTTTQNWSFQFSTARQVEDCNV